MLTLTCTLRLSDTESVSASVKADSPHALVPVEWTGAVARVPHDARWRSSQPAVLRAHFRALAQELKATFEEQVSGHYTSWAR